MNISCMKSLFQINLIDLLLHLRSPSLGYAKKGRVGRLSRRHLGGMSGLGARALSARRWRRFMCGGGCARGVVCLRFAVVLCVFSG